MTLQVNIHEAKTHLSELLRRVEEGEEVTIARAGKPVAKIVRAEPVKIERRLGTGKGKIWLAPDWDAPMTDEELAEWYDAPLSTSDALPT